MIEESYVSFETAKLLKEKGFPSPNEKSNVDTLTCVAVFKGHLTKIQEGLIKPDNDYFIPTMSLAMRWLRA